ncbi:T9SS type A sorting domain-containing protein [Thalassobellus sediminis]|uniref:T9SS type A sorting domain-containing protein n=1 Tax=Thalassobellus sediminis TaxID=3367753 RepID=UPI0037A9691D
MKQKNILKSIVFLLVLVIHTNKIEAQEVLLTSGNSTTDTGGSVSYSVGQIMQQNATSSNGTVIKGIQFNFDASSLTVIDLETNLDVSTYPNPTTSILNIQIDDFKPKAMSYKLLDISGKLITSGTIKDKTTMINVNHLEMATYLLKINNTHNHTTKTFKIIKN